MPAAKKYSLKTNITIVIVILFGIFTVGTLHTMSRMTDSSSNRGGPIDWLTAFMIAVPASTWKRDDLALEWLDPTLFATILWWSPQFVTVLAWKYAILYDIEPFGINSQQSNFFSGAPVALTTTFECDNGGDIPDTLTEIEISSLKGICKPKKATKIAFLTKFINEGMIQSDTPIYDIPTDKKTNSCPIFKKITKTSGYLIFPYYNVQKDPLRDIQVAGCASIALQRDNTNLVYEKEMLVSKSVNTSWTPIYHLLGYKVHKQMHPYMGYANSHSTYFDKTFTQHSEVKLPAHPKIRDL